MVTSRWDEGEAAGWRGEIAERVYSSRLLGSDPDLVLHGGGNTSVKSRYTTVFGEEIDVLVVKGSGADLAVIDEEGFAWLRLDYLTRLAELVALSDAEMAVQLLAAGVVAGRPAPSVEAILHAVLPHRFVDHTHADAVVTLTNTPRAASVLAEVYGDTVVVVPYVMPGFELARACAARVGDVLRPGVVGMVLMNHGIFTFGESAKQSYDRMIELVGMADDHLSPYRASRRDSQVVTGTSATEPTAAPAPRRRERARLRSAIAAAAGAPVVMSSHADDPTMAFIHRADLAAISQRGPVTPDHVIRTKPLPLLGRDVEAYAADYQAYFERHRSRSGANLRALDPAPRVVLDPELGMCCVGRSARDARIVEDIYRHTMEVISDATAIGGYQPVGPSDLFDVEYWELEQAKLHLRGAPPPFTGEVALVTGAASGIGRACAEALMREGAAVAGIDLNPEVKSAFDGPQWLGMEADVTDAEMIEQAFEQVVGRFGGLDLLVLNAGVFPSPASLSDLDLEGWRRAMAVNADANVAMLGEAHPLLCMAPRGGRVVVIGSKNVPAPGPGAAGYSASKAALTQLSRVAALEWGADGIRVNVIHPNAVFDTGLWTDEVVAERAARYGLSVESYRTDNLLRTEVTSADVARLCVAMCGPAFAKTTGAQVPVDGGNARVV